MLFCLNFSKFYLIELDGIILKHFICMLLYFILFRCQISINQQIFSFVFVCLIVWCKQRDYVVIVAFASF